MRLRYRAFACMTVTVGLAIAPTSASAAGGSIGGVAAVVSGPTGILVGTALPDRWRGRNVTVLPTRKRVVALTIDCGSGNEGLSVILRSLRKSHVAATFFVTGRFAKRFPGGVRRIAAAGHVIGNHSTNHPDFRTLSADRRRSEIRRANRWVSAETGHSTRPWFRFPYGSYDGAAIKQTNQLGYAVIGWTVDTLGWMGTSGSQSVASVRRRAVSAARPGEIVLMHAGATPRDGSTLDADALPGIIRRLSAKGFRFVSLDAGIRR